MANEQTTNKNYDKRPEGNWARSQLGKDMRRNLDALDVDLEVPWDFNLQPEGEQTGVVVDTATTVYTGVVSRTIPAEVSASAHDITFLAAYTESGAADEVIEARIIDESDGSIIDSVSFSATGQQSVTVTDTELPDDQAVHVEWVVTTASATAGAAGDLNAALVEVQ